MKKYSLLFVHIYASLTLFAQETTPLRLTRDQAEQIFLDQNLELLAEKMNISMADAAVAQAKLWENPTFTLSDFNVWKAGEEREFSLELSQLVQTANKRGKLVRMEKISREIAVTEFEELLRALKTDLRKQLDELLYLQEYRKVLDNQVASLTQLTASYARQVQQGNLAKSELLRLQAALLEADNEQVEITTGWNGLQKEIKNLLHLAPQVVVEIETGSKTYVPPGQLTLSHLVELAGEHHPGLKRAGLQTSYFEKSLALEKARRIPDLTFSAAYDRYGGVWKDFVGLGVSIDLPLFNRNQGNIRSARIQVEQSRIEANRQQNTVWNEIAEALANYSTFYTFYERLEQNPVLQELDEMLAIYTRNLLERNISMLEYIDFIETYKSNKETFLRAARNLSGQLEELQYKVGTELNENGFD
ncbi:MAG: TolC family protein [Tannerellaceae bacterium]|nr:TolC family protein [Tannerellaceae bacterium]